MSTKYFLDELCKVVSLGNLLFSMKTLTGYNTLKMYKIKTNLIWGCITGLLQMCDDISW